MDRVWIGLEESEEVWGEMMVFKSLGEEEIEELERLWMNGCWLETQGRLLFLVSAFFDPSLSLIMTFSGELIHVLVSSLIRSNPVHTWYVEMGHKEQI